MSKASQRNAQMRHYLLLVTTKHYQHIFYLNKHLFWLLAFKILKAIFSQGQESEQELHSI